MAGSLSSNLLPYKAVSAQNIQTRKLPLSGSMNFPVVMRTSLSLIIIRSASPILSLFQARFLCQRACVTQSQVELMLTSTTWLSAPQCSSWASYSASSVRFVRPGS